MRFYLSKRVLKLQVFQLEKEWSRLGEKQKGKSTLEHIKIENERSDLYKALGTSICKCPGCNQIDRNMTYNAFLKGWYCTCCVQEYRNFYYKKKAILDEGGFIGDFDVDFHESFL